MNDRESKLGKVNSESGPHLILPVETAARELDAKLLLALFAARSGMTVTIGNKALINLRIGNLEPGIYLSHNFNAGRDRIISIARDLGHRIVAWDEEGLVWINPEIYRQRRANPSALAKLDMLLLWGAEQHEAMLPALAATTASVAVVGNPRADLLRPELRPITDARVRALKQEFGDFILVNSNFGWINHALAEGRDGGLAEHLASAVRKSGFSLAYLQHRHAIYSEFVNLIPVVARQFPNRKIIVRRHPSESADAWGRALGATPNVEFKFDSDLVPWLLAAAHILQNGCTTAVETALLGRAAISYRPTIMPEHEIPQPARVSHHAHTAEDVVALLQDEAATDRVPQSFTAALDTMVAARSGALSSARICDELQKLHPAKVSGLQRNTARTKAFVRRMEKNLLRHIPGSASQQHYVDQKFPAMPVTEIEARLGLLSRQLDIAMPRVHGVSDRIFRITR
jgi:surface carbohydrate biosynthesis protein